MSKIERSSFVENKHLIFLDNLRESGITNMFGARSYIKEAFPELTSKQAGKVLVYWMETFGERHKEDT